LAADASSARAVLRGVAISPRKLDAFAALLRGLPLEDALVQCRLHPKKAARICEKVLLSARANASNNHGLAEPRLLVAEAWVGRGSHLVRAAIHGRGRTGVRHKYRAHLTVVLREAAAAPRRRVRELPPLWERRKVWDMREGKGGGEARDARWWHWSPRQRAPAERAL
jgi:large subunit ribosomal protein L22